MVAPGPAADLEIRLRPAGDESYVVAVWFCPAGSAVMVDLIGDGPLAARFDREALRVLSLDAEAYGRELSAALFAEPRLREACRRAYDQAQQASGGLRVRLHLDQCDQGLQQIRWELLQFSAGAGATILPTSQRVLFSRYLSPDVLQPAPRASRGSLAALVVIASPDDITDYHLAPINVAGERAQIDRALGGMPVTVLVSGSPGRRPTLSNLLEALSAGPDIVYLCCHGTFDDGSAHLWLEREDGRAEQVEGNRLADAVANLAKCPLLVVLASCHSAGRSGDEAHAAALGPALVARGHVPAVLAMQDQISAATISAFMPAFFAELRRDGQIDRAVAAARARVVDRPDWWHPALFMCVGDGLIWEPPPGREAYEVGDKANPYLGLHTFTYDDHLRYGGRERLATATVALLTRPGEQLPLLFITGASGSGKSSFAQAGLLPALAAHYRRQGLDVSMAVFRPSRQPLAGLAEALRRLGVPADGVFAPASLFMPPGTPVARDPNQVSLLVVDQFEELFTQADPVQRDALCTILEHLPDFQTLRGHILVTVRSDYLPELFQRPALYALAKRGIELRAMSVDELKTAILKPMQAMHPAAGVQFEPELLERLAKDASRQSGYLPLLQATLEDLWKRGWLTLGAYGQLTDGIRNHAEQVYLYSDPELGTPRSEAERALIMRIFLDLVDVSLDDDRRRDVGVQRTVDELTEGEPARERLVEDLVRQHLNLACEAARGEIIICWDDDWYSTNRISYQVAPFLEGREMSSASRRACSTAYPQLSSGAAPHGCTTGCSPTAWLVAPWPSGGVTGLTGPASPIAHSPRMLLSSVSSCGGARIEKLSNQGKFIYIRHDSNSWRFTPGTFLDHGGWRLCQDPTFVPADALAFYGSVRGNE